MKKIINILIVDDSSDDTKLLIRHLTQEGYTPRFERVDTPSRLIQELRGSKSWEIILMDHAMPEFSSKGAIELVKAENCDIPVVIVSGYISEVEAVIAMRDGAKDIIFKDNLSRLTAVIDRELREAKIRIKKREAEAQVKTLSQAVEQSRNMVFISDSSGVITYANSSFLELTGYSLNRVLENTATLLDAGDDHICYWSNKKVCCSWHDQQMDVVFSGNSWRGEVFLQRKNGENFWALVSISPIKNDQGDVVNLVNVGEDLSELKAKQAELARMAFYDSVTGLANRRLLDDRMQQLLNSNDQFKNSNRSSDCNGKVAALLCLDLDRFKKVNDKLGHGAGDNLLKWVAEKIQSCIRKSDTAARTGGDEFHVLITELSSEADIDGVAKNILTKLNEPFVSGAISTIISTSMGIVSIPRDGNDIKELKTKGDIALYYAKDKGRNNYQHYVDGMKLEKIQHTDSKVS